MQTSHCPWWVRLSKQTLSTWLVQLASSRLLSVPRGKIKIPEPGAQVTVATFLKHPDITGAISELWLQLSEEHHSRCSLGVLWTQEGLLLVGRGLLLRAYADHSSSPMTRVPGSAPHTPPPPWALQGFQHLDNTTIFGRLHHPPTSPTRASRVVEIYGWETFY